MKVVTSICEKDFVFKNIANGLRLDGRGPQDARSLEIVFGSENGCCIVIQGNSRVLAQVSCEITAPKPSRPAEGSLNVNLELSPMAAPNFKGGRMSDEGIEATRLLERCIRDSRCIDLEALCIVSGLKVWTIRVDVQALNNDGNIVECASIAAISALAHFRRPDVTVVGIDITVHSPDDHEPIPLNLHHMPINIVIAIYEQGTYVLLDPVELEERVAEGKVVIGVNAHQEICSLHLSGALKLKKEIILRCTDIAVKRAQAITQMIRAALDDDAYKKATNQPTGFVSLLQTGTILGSKCLVPRLDIKIPVTEPEESIVKDESEESDVEEIIYMDSPKIKETVRRFLQKPEVALFEGGMSKWNIEEEEESEEEEEEDKNSPKEEKMNVSELVHDVSESEDEAVFLQSDQVDIKDNITSTSRGWYSKNPF